MDQRVKKTNKPASRPGVRALRAPELLAARIKNRIVRGELREGDVLPAENKMIEEYGVSRPTVREAYRILEAERLVSVARGARGGALVHAPDPELIASYTQLVLQAEKATIDEVYLTLALLEPPVVRVLAMRGAEVTLQQLRQSFEALNASIGNLPGFARALTGFHNLLVELSGNRPLMHMFAALRNVVERHHIRVTTAKHADAAYEAIHTDMLPGVKSCKKLIDLLASGDADRAEAHWRKHWENAYKSWVKGYEGRLILELFEDTAL
jgi:DNA-binding FadR family transcriptional regulator